jgi:hypothetical protein
MFATPLESLPRLREFEHRIVVVHVVRADRIIRFPPEVPQQHRPDRVRIHTAQVVLGAAGLATSPIPVAPRDDDRHRTPRQNDVRSMSVAAHRTAHLGRSAAVSLRA